MLMIDLLEPRRLLDAVGVSLVGSTDLSTLPTVPGGLIRMPLRAEVRNFSPTTKLSPDLSFFAVPVNLPGIDPIQLNPRPIRVNGISPEMVRQIQLNSFRLPQDMRPGTYRIGVVVDPDGRINPDGFPNSDLSTSTFTVSYTLSSANPNLTFRLDDATVRATYRGPGTAVLTRNEPAGTYDLTIRETNLSTRIGLNVGSAAAKIRNVNSNTPIGTLDLRRANFAGTLTLNGGTNLFFPSLTTPTPQSVILGGNYRNLTFANLDRVNFVVSAAISTLRAANVNNSNFLSTRSVSRFIVANISASNIRMIGDNSAIGRFTSRTFSDSRITTPTLGGASLGRVTIAEVGRTYGIAADAGGRITGTGFRPYPIGAANPFQQLDFGLGNRSTFSF